MLRATENMVNCKYTCCSLTALEFRGIKIDGADSRTAYQYIASIGEKNVYRIFAGGDHSWVVIDDIIPIKSNYRVPSPVPNYTQQSQPQQRTKSR